jgi:hypothetical protein
VRVVVVRGGGVAGISTRTELGASALPSDDADTLAGMVDDAGLREEPTPSTGQRHPDQMLYEVVLAEGDMEVSRHFSDEDLPEEVSRLIQWIDARPERIHRRET